MAFLNINQVRRIMVWLDSDIKDAKREVDLVEVSFISSFILITCWVVGLLLYVFIQM